MSRSTFIASKANRNFTTNAQGDDMAPLAQQDVNQVQSDMSIFSDVIPIINKIQDAIQMCNIDTQSIDLPQIVVVGSQNVGKSSVLEAICKREFLPRGNGIVTRRPLILQLYQTRNSGKPVDDQSQQQEWCEFLHMGSKKYFDSEEIRHEIENETNRVTQGTQGISSIPINLRFYSPFVVPLTLVDLPGLVKVSVHDQASSIVDEIENCVLTYAQMPNSIILAVSDAPNNLATSDALCIAKKVDPNGQRTIGVLTKMDLLNPGTELEVLKTLKNEEYPLKLGWFGVVNRSQDKIDKKIPIAQQIQDEYLFFCKHQTFKQISSRLGIPLLTKHLSQDLIRHIYQKLPALKLRLQQQLDVNERIIEQCGEEITNTDEKKKMIQKAIFNYEREFQRQLDGSKYSTCNELICGARIANIFKTYLPEMLQKVTADAALQKIDMEIQILNASGLQPTLFPPIHAFNNIVSEAIMNLEQPCQNCLNQVKHELLQMVTSITSTYFEQYRLLAREVVKVAIDLIESNAIPTSKFLKNCIKSELAYINIYHPDLNVFADFESSMRTTFKTQILDDESLKEGSSNGNSKLSHEEDQSQQQELDQQLSTAAPCIPDLNNMNISIVERFGIDLYPKLLAQYYEIMRKKILDSVPKICMSFLVNEVKEQLQQILVSKVLNGPKFETLLQEDPQVGAMRETAKKMKELLQAGLDALFDVGIIKSYAGHGKYE